MQLSNAMLDMLCHQETCEEIIRAIPPATAGIVALQIEDELTHQEVGALFGVSDKTIGERLRHARDLVAWRVPELRLEIRSERCACCGVPLRKLHNRKNSLCRECLESLRGVWG